MVLLQWGQIIAVPFGFGVSSAATPLPRREAARERGGLWRVQGEMRRLPSGGGPQRVELAILCEYGERLALELADGVVGDPQPATGLAERGGVVAVDPVPQLHHLALARGE